MTPEEQLDEARAEEAYRQWQEEGCQGDDTIDVAARAARLARENWTPPEPVDPDVLAFREWLANDHEADAWTGGALLCRLGRHDNTEEARAFLAGARMAREQERERAKVLVDCARNDAARLLELAAINNFDETVADGGITSGMVCRQEIEQIARSLSATLAKHRGEA